MGLLDVVDLALLVCEGVGISVEPLTNALFLGGQLLLPRDQALSPGRVLLGGLGEAALEVLVLGLDALE